MAETKTPIARESLEDSWESLSRTVFKLKSDRDTLLEACKEAFISYGRYGDVSIKALQQLEAAIKRAERPAE